MNPEKAEYIILTAMDINDLMYKVNARIKMGFWPHGSLVVGPQNRLYQPMYKGELEVMELEGKPISGEIIDDE